MSKPKQWSNRIIGSGQKPASEFQFNPLNWRRHPEHQTAAIRSILSSIGWVTGVIENIRTGNLIDGHARVSEALAVNPSQLIPFIQVDLSEEEEKKILALLDPIASLATTEEEQIGQLLAMIEIDDALQAVVDNLMENRISTDEIISEWQGMPEFVQENKEAEYQVIVNFATSADLMAFADLIGQSMTVKTKCIWFPKAEIVYTDKIRYADSEGL